MSMAKKIYVVLVLLFFSLPLLVFDVHANTPIVIHFFYLESCPNCHIEELYLTELQSQNNNVTIVRYEVSDPQNQILYDQVYTCFNDAETIDYNLRYGTPFTVIGGYAFSGFNDQSKNNIEKMISHYTTQQYVDIVSKIINEETIEDSDFDSIDLQTGDIVTLPIIGDISIESVSLGLAAILLGFVDGFNPCAMWILVFLITMLANQRDRKRMWILGSTFLFTSALVYFLAMTVWMQVAITFTEIVWIRIAIGVVAFIFGVYNLSKFVKTVKTPEIGCEVVDENKRRKIIDKIKIIISEKHLVSALIGIILLAISVNLIELACSAGLPLLFSQIVAFNHVAPTTSIMLTLLYVFFFIIDDLVIFSIAMITLKVTGITNKYTRFSHLVGGLIMIIIGFLLIFFPSIIMLNF